MTKKLSPKRAIKQNYLSPYIIKSSLAKIKFDPSRGDIESICRFFNMGKLLNYEKEKGVTFPHANFFFFIEATRGQYAVKFYPRSANQTIGIEYTINRLLTARQFPTPLMHSGDDNQPYLKSNGRLATCFSYIDGLPAWQNIRERDTIRQVNGTLLSLKNILSTHKQLRLLKQDNFVKKINTLTHTSRLISPYDQKDTIDTSLLHACRIYQQHKNLFTRQWLHNQPSLANFLNYQKTIYILDLEHIQEDYALSDLASMVTSCLSFNIPASTIKTIIKDYFTQHKLARDHLLVLNTLVKIGLVRIFLKNIQREKTVTSSPYSSELKKNYKSGIFTRKDFIISLLKKMNETQRYIV